MPSSKSRRSSVNCQPGERADVWLARAHAAYHAEGVQARIDAGRWLPPEEYARLTGRPGRVLPPTESLIAERHRAAATPPASLSPTSVAHAPVVAVNPWAGLLAREASTMGYDAATAAALSVLSEVLTDGRPADLGETAKRGAVAGTKSALRSAATRGVASGIERGMAAFGTQTVSAGAATTVREVGKAVARETAAATARSALRANAVGAAAGLVVDQGVDTIRLFNGDIDGAEYGRRTIENGAGAGGGLGGAVAGAALGTAIFPGVGTVVGGFLGGLGGGVALGSLARWIVR